MLALTNEASRWIVAGAAFGLTMGIWLVVLIIWRMRHAQHADRIKERLGMLHAEGNMLTRTRTLRLWHDQKESTLLVPQLPSKASWMARMENLRHEAGWKVPAMVLLPAVLLSAGLIAVVVFSVSNHGLAGIFAGVVTVIVSWAVLKRAVARRREFFDQQFTDALELATRSLRAGHPLTGAFQLVAEEIGEPVGPLFKSICQQQMMGLSLEEAIQVVSKASSSDDMALFAASLSMQMRSGGNLAHMMERLTLVIRDRMRLSRRVRILTAQTQFGKRILIALPFVLMVVLSIVNPKYIDPLYSTTQGQILLSIGGVMVLLGMWSMNKMAVLRY